MFDFYVYVYSGNRYDRVIEYYAIALIDPPLRLMTPVPDMYMTCTRHEYEMYM